MKCAICWKLYEQCSKQDFYEHATTENVQMWTALDTWVCGKRLFPLHAVMVYVIFGLSFLLIPTEYAWQFAYSL